MSRNGAAARHQRAIIEGVDPLIRRANDADAPAVAHLFLRSFRTTYPSFRQVHSDDETAEWIASEVIPEYEAWVAESTAAELVGWMVVAPGELEHLYLAPEWIGRGLGDRFMALAKERQPGGLRLYTFPGEHAGVPVLRAPRVHGRGSERRISERGRRTGCPVPLGAGHR